MSKWDANDVNDLLRQIAACQLPEERTDPGPTLEEGLAEIEDEEDRLAQISDLKECD